jgi:hypothetical protein
LPRFPLYSPSRYPRNLGNCPEGQILNQFLDACISIIGTRAFDKFVEIQPGYEDLTNEEKEELKENIFDKWIGYVLLYQGS